jgi:hypothetical protein
LTLYNRDDIDVIGLDDAASKLGIYLFISDFYILLVIMINEYRSVF